MPRVLAVLIVTLTLPLLWASRSVTFDQEALDAAMTLAGLDRNTVTVTLADTPPPSASRGIEAWTSYDADGTPQQIFVYTRSDMFRCARWPFGMRQCRIRLASVLIHEAWHFDHGQGERDAYEAQIAFLMKNGAATEHVKAVRLAQNRVLAAERRTATETDR